MTTFTLDETTRTISIETDDVATFAGKTVEIIIELDQTTVTAAG